MCCAARLSPTHQHAKWSHPITADKPEFDLARAWPVDLLGWRRGMRIEAACDPIPLDLP
jgi:hypothetical protein